MLLSFKTSGFRVFDQMVELTMDVSKGVNTIEINDHNVLKSAIIYGANNAGKSSLISAVQAMKSLYEKGDMKEFSFFREKNFFIKDTPITFEIEFMLGKYTYLYGLDLVNKELLNEYLYINKTCVFSRGDESESVKLDNKYFSEKILKNSYDFLNRNELFMSKANSYSNKIQNIHIQNVSKMFGKLRFFDNHEASEFIDLAIECMEDMNKCKLYNDFLQKADVSLEGKEMKETFGLPNVSDDEFLRDILEETKQDIEDVRQIARFLKIHSKYKKGTDEVSVPSSLFDSVGTSKFSNLLLLILHTIEHGDILFIDEIDNSLHYRLTRELIKLMNASSNNSGQFVMTAHDTKLLTPLLFRKEQINLISRKNSIIEMYSLGDFSDIRNDSSFENLYVKEKVGALPNPDFDPIVNLWQENNTKDRVKN